MGRKSIEELEVELELELKLEQRELLQACAREIVDIKLVDGGTRDFEAETRAAAAEIAADLRSRSKLRAA